MKNNMLFRFKEWLKSVKINAFIGKIEIIINYIL